MSNINQFTPFLRELRSSVPLEAFDSLLLSSTILSIMIENHKKQKYEKWVCFQLSLSTKCSGGEGWEYNKSKDPCKGNWLWILWQSTNELSLLRLLTAGQARSIPQCTFVAPAGPIPVSHAIGQKSAQVWAAGCSAPARFDGRKAAPPGPVLVSAGPQQVRISDLFQSQEINYQLRNIFQGNTKLCLPGEDTGWDKFSSLGATLV